MASVGGRPKSRLWRRTSPRRARSPARRRRRRDEDHGFAHHQTQNSCRWAPSAMRIPISLVRRVTLYDISPNRPIEASSSARTPNSVTPARTASPAEPLFDLFELRRDIHQRQVRSICRTASRTAPVTAPADARRAHFEYGAADPRLRVWHVHRRRGGVADTVVFDVAQDADDFELARCFDARTKPLANRILVREVLFHRGLVDHHHFRRCLAVAVGQTAAREDRDSHDLEEFGDMTRRLMLLL